MSENNLVATSLSSFEFSEKRSKVMTTTTQSNIPVSSIFQSFTQSYGERHNDKPMTLSEYLEEARVNSKMYQTPHEAMVEAFGKPRHLDTSTDPRLRRIYQNRILRVFDSFEGNFFGMYEVIEQIYSYFLRASQGLDERHKVLYLLGPVGGGKSSLAEHLKMLMERIPFYALAVEKEGGAYHGKYELSPVFESPLGLFSEQGQRTLITDNLGIHERYIPRLMSPWAMKRLQEDLGGDISRFKVARLYPSILNQIGISVASPGDETTQDVSTLVGKNDVSKLGLYPQNDPDAYLFSGALCRGTRFMEFVEMFKAPIKTLNPLLPALTENYFSSVEGFSIPFHGIVMAHSNEAEWGKFRSQRENEAFISRVSLVKVPYCLGVSDEIQIYEKLISKSALKDAPCAPDTLKTLASFAVLTRMVDPTANSTWLSKLRVYNGENLKDVDTKARAFHEYRADAGVNEGMTGFDMRHAYEVLAKTYNADPDEIAADSVELLHVLENEVRQKEFGGLEDLYIGTFIKGILRGLVDKGVEDVIKEVYFETSDSFGQETFDRYMTWAEHWIESTDYNDPNTHTTLDRAQLNAELEKIEKPAGIANPKDFRNEIVMYVLRYRADHKGEMPVWTSYEKMKRVIEKNLFSRIDDLMPVISFTRKESEDLQEKHNNFVSRMMQKGFTEKQVRKYVDWHIRTKKSS